MSGKIPAGAVRRVILVTGLVQGVGFRPFVARLAAELNITGKVINSGRGVEIDARGSGEKLAEFALRLKSDAPPMALVLSVEVSKAESAPALDAFTIEASRVDPFASIVVPPDIATCRECEREITDATDRRFCYPFTNCTNCGPRYTIIEAVPYDRQRTSMKAFAMCDECRAEYESPLDRRFHAQPNACPVCGPHLRAVYPDGRTDTADVIAKAAKLLARGGIVALMGVGGLHLACDAKNEEAVAELRRRKTRPLKPLAVMGGGLAAARRVAEIGSEAEQLLFSPEAPIVLCPPVNPSPLAPSVAPGQAQVGVFLPSTPLHKLLFAAGGPELLVMTSGNRSDEPIISDDQRALAELCAVADLFLLHDRPIVHPVDDSVVKLVRGIGPTIIRRSRGYAPKPFALPTAGSPILAVGAELLNTVTIAKDGLAFVGPHAGDLKNPQTEDAFRRTIGYLKQILRVEPDVVACDLHPGYLSSRFAEELEEEGAKVVRVQHHEAHGAACMAENGFFDREGLALVLDGLGLGRDGTLWGGELFAGRPDGFRRVGHLAAVPQPGGDAASREPWRMAASWLYRSRGADWRKSSLPAFADRSPGELETLEMMMEKGVNSPLTSSCGRLFDAAAAILGFSGRMTYTAQAPMELEALAQQAVSARTYPPAEISCKNGVMEINPANLLEALTADALSGADRCGAALGFHLALAESFAKLLVEGAEATGLREVFLSGGCFQNGILLSEVFRMGSERGLTMHAHRLLPSNDGGISLGQAFYATLLSPGGG